MIRLTFNLSIPIPKATVATTTWTLEYKIRNRLDKFFKGKRIKCIHWRLMKCSSIKVESRSAFYWEILFIFFLRVWPQNSFADYQQYLCQHLFFIPLGRFHGTPCEPVSDVILAAATRNKLKFRCKWKKHFMCLVLLLNQATCFQATLSAYHPNQICQTP